MTGPPVFAPKDVTTVDLGINDPTTIAQAQDEMAKFGITMHQVAKGYRSRISEAAFQNVSPSNYAGQGKHIWEGIKDILNPFKEPASSVKDPDRPDALLAKIAKNGVVSKQPYSYAQAPSAEDAWRLYLGMPQQHKTFGISSFRPSNSKEIKPYYSLPGLVRDLNPSTIQNMVRNMGGRKSHGRDWTLGDYTIDFGSDEVGGYISYYDKWDLAAPGADHVGHPFEVYDRIYYDPKSFEHIPTEKVLWAKSKLDDSHKSALMTYVQTLIGNHP